MKHPVATLAFLLYVIVLAVGVVDQAFLDSRIFPPALDRQLLGMLDVLKDRSPSTLAEAKEAAGAVRERLAGIRLERETPKVEQDLAQYASGGTAVEACLPLLEQARRQAVANLVSNDEFSLTICIRALDPDLVLRLWVPGCDDLKVRQGCLEALQKIRGTPGDLGYDPNASTDVRREAVRQWRDWHLRFMEERRRPAPTPAAPQGKTIP